jgi:hypothetical protein
MQQKKEKNWSPAAIKALGIRRLAPPITVKGVRQPRKLWSGVVTSEAAPSPLAHHSNGLLRIGIITGSLVAGIVGTRRLTYDVWGNTANISQRLQEACEPGRINISGSTFHQVAALFETEPRGRIEVKHMDPIDMYFLNRIQPHLAADAEGCLPNDRFWNASGVG